MTYYNVTVTNIKDGRETHIYKYVKHLEFIADRDTVKLHFSDGYTAIYNLKEWRVTAETIHLTR